MKEPAPLRPSLCLMAAALVILLLAGCAPGREIEALLLLRDISAGEGPTLLKRLRPEPQQSYVSFRIEERSYEGDLYIPRGGADAALLLIPGAAEEGKDDPRLIAFARSLARAGFAVFVPDLPTFRALQVHSGNIDEVADVFAWLASRPELSRSGITGMSAFSYAAGPAILAALRPQIRDRVDFIFAIGPYYDLEEVLFFFTTGWFHHDGEWRYLRPNDYGKWIFVLSNLERVPPEDREVTREMAQRMMLDPHADLSDLVPRLTAEGRDIHAFITNTDPDTAPHLLSRLPQDVIEEIAALDLSDKDLSLLQADLILVHGYEDDIIPFTQSLSLQEALPAEQSTVYLVHGLLHVDLDPGIGDLWRLWRAASALLAQRR
jgi:alpha-beta hydrolase superfamily lysophospholipase